jgi:tRNA A37 threonylcarbamoyladenosine synthetase subunit TsaC/SUA5/YrdC
LNRPITATSANRSGVVPKQKIDEIENDLSPYIEGIWAGVEGDERRYERPSTIVRVLENEVEILREGPISEEAILGELRLTGLL